MLGPSGEQWSCKRILLERVCPPCVHPLGQGIQSFHQTVCLQLRAVHTSLACIQAFRGCCVGFVLHLLPVWATSSSWLRPALLCVCR